MSQWLNDSMKIIPISLPTPFYIGPVNVYLIAEDPITIIDTGPKTKEAVEALRAGLRQAGRALSDLCRNLLPPPAREPFGDGRAPGAAATDARLVGCRCGTGHPADHFD